MRKRRLELLDKDAAMSNGKARSFSIDPVLFI